MSTVGIFVLLLVLFFVLLRWYTRPRPASGGAQEAEAAASNSNSNNSNGSNGSNGSDGSSDGD